jgi:hypothetical protein
MRQYPRQPKVAKLHIVAYIEEYIARFKVSMEYSAFFPGVASPEG